MTWTRRGLLAAGLSGLAGCLGPAPSSRRDCAADGTARVGFVGDVMLGRGVTERWAGADPAGVWGDTLGRLRALDGLVLNLECCVSARGERWPGKTYYFRADPAWATAALSAAEASVAALANNHVLDYREPALRDTIAALESVDVAHAGAGQHLAAAVEPAVTRIGDLTVATISLTDRFPPYAATPTGAGTAFARLDRVDPRSHLLAAAGLERASAHDPDLVVASLHWGPNWRTRPAATQAAFARWLVDQGVDVVHGHSAHVLQGVEVYRGRPIVHDAGDFVDDYVRKDGRRNKYSALFELEVADGDLERLRLVPIEIAAERATLADGAAAAWVRRAVRDRSAPFGTPVERAGEGLSIPLGGC